MELAPSPKLSGAPRMMSIRTGTRGWRHGIRNDPWMQFQAVDLVRGAARGKPFWHAEATGGPLWMQPQVLNRPLEDGRSSDDKDVRVWSLIDMMAGASGILFTRWRPLLDGPLFGAFGPMGMDGSIDAAGRDGWRIGALDELAPGYLEVTAGEGRRGNRVCAGVRRFQPGTEWWGGGR